MVVRLRAKMGKVINVGGHCRPEEAVAASSLELGSRSAHRDSPSLAARIRCTPMHVLQLLYMLSVLMVYRNPFPRRSAMADL